MFVTLYKLYCRIFYLYEITNILLHTIHVENMSNEFLHNIVKELINSFNIILFHC